MKRIPKSNLLRYLIIGIMVIDAIIMGPGLYNYFFGVNTRPMTIAKAEVCCDNTCGQSGTCHCCAVTTNKCHYQGSPGNCHYVAYEGTEYFCGPETTCPGSVSYDCEDGWFTDSNCSVDSGSSACGNCQLCTDKPWCSGGDDDGDDDGQDTPTPQNTPTPTSTPVPCGGTINGYIWNDVNLNGVWENETEPGVNDIHVLLEDSTGKAIIPTGCVDTNRNGRIDALTTNEAEACGFWPVAITGGDPRKGAVIDTGMNYYAAGARPVYLLYQHVWNPVVSTGTSAGQITAIQKRLYDLQPRSDIDYTGQYLYSRYSGYYEFQNVPIASYKLKVLTSVWEQENWGMYPIDNRYYFPFPRPLQFTAPQYREVDVTVSSCNQVVTASNSAPIGFLDHAGRDYISGWACDKNGFPISLSIHFYLDGPAGTGTFLGSTTANVQAGQGVADQCGGYANHGFVISTLSIPSGTHTVYAYAINIPTGDNPSLSQSPMTIP